MVGGHKNFLSPCRFSPTSQGGTHQAAFREAIAKTIKEFYHKDYDPSDIRTSIIAAISIKVTDPIFENQMKTKYGSKEVEPGVSVNNFVADFLTKHLDDYLHKHAETAQILQRKIVENEKERKAISGIQKKARETAKKVSLNNKKLRDCKIHLTDRNDLAEQSMIFITEGNSASGSITKSRDVRTQAVFSLRGKPLNCYGLTKKVVYENEEFNLLQAALNIEEDMDNLRYNKVVIATDADVDGMHIRLLMMTFFLQFFPEVIRQGHLFVLQTPLFRVRNKKETLYCYSEEERLKATRRNQFTVEVVDGVYVVKADWLANALTGVNMEDYESLQYFQRVLIQSGIIKKLEDMGINEGDTVSILDFEFEYVK